MQSDNHSVRLAVRKLALICAMGSIGPSEPWIDSSWRAIPQAIPEARLALDKRAIARKPKVHRRAGDTHIDSATADHGFVEPADSINSQFDIRIQDKHIAIPNLRDIGIALIGICVPILKIHRLDFEALPGYAPFTVLNSCIISNSDMKVGNFRPNTLHAGTFG